MVKKPKPSAQIDKFKDAARKLGTDDDEARFDERLKRIGKPRRDPKIIGKDAG